MNTQQLETMTDDSLLDSLAAMEGQRLTGWEAILYELMQEELEERTERAA